MRKTPFFLVLILALAVAVPAYAAVENIKLSGDITVRGFYRDNYALGGDSREDVATFNGGQFAGKDQQRFFTNTVRLRVNADLTQNITGELELLNQRDVDPPSGGGQGSGLVSSAAIGGSVPPSAGNDQFDVILNLANITIKELYYPELTLKIGRQNIQWGEGFVIGASQLANPDPSNSLSADEFPAFNSFDAIRAMVNKGDWHFDAVAAKIQENRVNAGDDENLLGINIGRTFSAYGSEAEIYYINDRDASPGNNQGDVFEGTEKIDAFGTRGSIRPFDRLKLSGETVFEFGKEGGAAVGGHTIGAGTTAAAFTPNGLIRQNIRAWAFDLRGEWEWRELPWPTTLGTEWVYYSGEENAEAGSSNNYRPLFRGKYHSAIREFQGYFYFPNVGVTPAYDNQHQIMWDALLHPFNNKDLTLFTRWLIFWFDNVPIAGRGNKIGSEWDTKFSYDYTQDLKFSLIGALFFPGDYFHTSKASPNSLGGSSTQAGDTAKELVAEVALAF